MFSNIMITTAYIIRMHKIVDIMTDSMFILSDWINNMFQLKLPI